MRSRLFRSSPFLVALAMLASCSVEQEVAVDDNVPGDKDGFSVHFTTRSIETRTAFGDAETTSDGTVRYPCYWTSNDSQIRISLNYEYAVTAGVNTDETDAAGHITRSSFDATFDGVDTVNPYTFYLVSPADAFLWASPEREAVSVTIGAAQKPSASSVDEKTQILVAKSDSYSAIPENVTVDFKHITSYGKLTLNGLSDNPAFPGNASLTSVTLISEDQPLAGSWYYHFSDGSIAEKEGSNSIIVDTGDLDVVGGDPVWFAAAPVAMAGRKLTVRANFSDGSYLERTITLNGNFNFSSGKVIKFSVNMAGAKAGSYVVETSSEEVVFQLVKSTSGLAADDEIIIVNSTSPSYAMTSSSSSSGLAATSSGFSVGSDGNIRLANAGSVMVLKVKSIQSSSIVLWDGSSKYLSYTSSGSGFNQSRYLSLDTSTLTWTLSISNGSANLYNKGTGASSYYVRYSNDYFNLNRSSGTVAIYKKVTVGTTDSADISDDPVTDLSDYGAYLSNRNLVYNAATDQISREYNGDGTLTFTIIAPAEDQAVEFSGIPSSAGLGDKFTLGLTYISGITTEISKNYSVFVVKEEGRTLWLTDGSGNGFIVKR